MSPRIADSGRNPAEGFVGSTDRFCGGGGGGATAAGVGVGVSWLVADSSGVELSRVFNGAGVDIFPKGSPTPILLRSL
jgi:hypothetical protein